MEQTKALNALEPFLALSKSATSPRAAADLIVRATSAPNTYIFTELLQTPQIQALANHDEFAPYLALLQIFSHGTYSSYLSTGGLPELNDAQRLKLRQLSLLSLAKNDSNAGSHGSPTLDYASLQKALDLPSRQALEELVISAIYAGLLKAQLNPKDSRVQINSVSPLRDVAPTAIGGLLSSLQAWAGRCEATLQSLSCQMAQLRADADRRAARASARAEEMRQLVENEQKGGQAPTPMLSISPLASSDAVAAAVPDAPASSLLFPRRNPRVVHSIPHDMPTPRPRGAGGGGGIDTNNHNATPIVTNTTEDEMSSLLTVGGGNSFPVHGHSITPAVPGTRTRTRTSAPDATHVQVKPAIKRGSDDMLDGGDTELAADAGVLGADDGGGVGLDGNSGRANRRKLGG